MSHSAKFEKTFSYEKNRQEFVSGAISSFGTLFTVWIKVLTSRSLHERLLAVILRTYNKYPAFNSIEKYTLDSRLISQAFVSSEVPISSDTIIS